MPNPQWALAADAIMTDSFPRLRAGVPGRTHMLVGGLRIGLGPSTVTPGPTAHIQGFAAAAQRLGYEPALFLASELKPLRHLATVPEGKGASTSVCRLLATDLLRMSAAGLTCWRLRRASHRTSPDVIYERVAVLQSLASFHRAKRRSVRVVESNGIMSRETAFDRQATRLYALSRIVERHVYRRADVIVAVSAVLASEIALFADVEQGKIVVVPNAIPLECLQTELVTDSGQITLGFVGAVVQWQGLERLLSALAKVNAERRPQIRLEVIGDGPALTGLRAQAAESELASHVAFLGRLPRTQAYARMASWSAGFSGHVSSSSADMYHSPLKLYEYAGLGLPVFCSPSADADALRSDGLPVFFFDDSNSLEDALRSFASTSARPAAEREELRTALYQRHSWDARVAKVMRAARSVSDSGAGPA